jgi:hypothetical protein
MDIFEARSFIPAEHGRSERSERLERDERETRKRCEISDATKNEKRQYKSRLSTARSMEQYRFPRKTRVARLRNWICEQKRDIEPSQLHFSDATRKKLCHRLSKNCMHSPILKWVKRVYVLRLSIQHGWAFIEI